MGQIIKRKIQRMSLAAKLSLVMVFTMLVSTFMYQGWYKPKMSAAAPLANGTFFYSNNSTTPQYRAYTASTNTFGAATATIAGVLPTWTVMQACPTRNEKLAGYVDSTGALRIYKWNGSAWREETNTATGSGGWGAPARPALGGNGVDGRRFDIAYEQVTGNAIVVYSRNVAGTNELGYRIWNGTAWSTAEITLDSARLTTAVSWVKLVSRPGANEITLGAQEIGTTTANTSKLTVMTWSGSAWGNEPTTAAATTMPNTTTPQIQTEGFDIAYESLSGDRLIVYTQGGTAGIYYRTYNTGGATLGTATSMVTYTTPAIPRLSSDPYSDKILVMYNRNASANIYARVWDGAALGASTTLAATSLNPTVIEKRHLNSAWLRSGTTSYAVAFWQTTTTTTIGYRVYDATAGTWLTAGTNPTAAAPQWIDLDVDPISPDTLMLTYSDSASDLWAKSVVIDGTGALTFTNADGGTAITTTLTTTNGILTQNFDFAYDQTKPPTLTTPTATAILDTTATLGANVTSDNGSAVTERGTVWNTTGTPTTADNKTTTTGTTGVFTTAVSSITAGTKIYYRGYAINSIGTSYSPQGSFYTKPATGASGVNFANINGGGMTVNWTRGSGNGVIVLMKAATAVTGVPADGTYTTYTASPAFASGTLIGDGYVVYKGTGTSVDVTGLAANTAYHVAVFEYSGAVDTAGVDIGTNYAATAATGNQTTAASQTITIGDATNPATTAVYRNETNKAVSAFTLQLTAGTGSPVITQLVVTGTASAGSSATETSAVKIYQDNNADRVWDAGDTLISSTTFATNTATFTGLSIPVTSTLANYIIVYDINAAATATRTLTASVTGASHTANTLTNNDNADATLTVTSQTLTYGNGTTQPAAKTVYRGYTNQAFDTFTLSTNGGSATVSGITVTGVAGGGALNSAAVANNVKLWQDNNGNNEWDAGDTLVGSTTFATNTAAFTGLNIPVTTASVSYIVTADILPTTTAAWTLTGNLSAMTSTANTNTDSDTAGATLTVGAAQTTTAGNGATQPAAKTVYRGYAKQAFDTFTLAVNAGATTVTQLVVAGTAGGGAANAAAVASNVQIWQDNGTTANEWDASDTLIASTTFATNTATFAGLSIPVTTAAVSYIVTADISPTATAAHTLTGQLNAPVSYAQTNTDADTAGATLTVGAAQTTTAGNGTTQPAAKTVYRGSLKQAFDTFTLSVNAGATTVTQLVVAGTAGGGAANAAAVASNVQIWQDNGTTANEWDASDTLIASTTFVTNTATFAGLSLPVTTTAVSYIVTADIISTATAAHTLTGQLNAPVSYAQTNTDADTAGATLTVGSNTLTVGEGTNPASRIVLQGSANEAVGAFTLQTNVGSSLVTDIVITGTNPSNVQSGGVKLWEDNGTTGTWDVADVQVGSGVTFSGTTATFTGLTVQPTAALKNYLVTYSIKEKATVGGTVTGYISGITATANTTTNSDNTVDATLTIKGTPFLNSCGSCHSYPPSDGTRAGATGAFVGAHQKHTNYVCSTCHVTPATETSADFGHRNKTIQMKATIAGGSYNGGTSIAQVNSPKTTYTCSNIACHGANNPTPVWGVGTAGCKDCHAGTITRTMAPGTLDNVVSEFGLAWGHKSGAGGKSRTAVTNSDCIVCHLEGNYTTQGNSIYHGDGNIDLRDPDADATAAPYYGEKPITDISGNAFTFQKFSMSFAAGSRTTNGHTSNSDIANVLTQKFCLACHDSNGAFNTTARTVAPAAGTQYSPWEGVTMGTAANYSVINGAASAGYLVDVKTQLATTNSSYHPVLGPLNRDFPIASRLIAPYNNQGSGRVAAGGTKSLSVVMNCFDCHNTPTTPLTDRTVSAHGNAVTLRGDVYVNPYTLCQVCHSGYTVVDNHASGSAMAMATGRSGEGFDGACYSCHGDSGDSDGAVLPTTIRPVRGQNYHGFDRLVSVVTWPGSGTKPYAFIRNTVTFAGAAGYHEPASSTLETLPGTGAVATCMGGTGCAGNGAAEPYTPGGAY